MLNTYFDPYLQLALWTGIGAAVLAVLATALIIYLRFALIQRTRRETAFLTLWRPILVKALGATFLSPLPNLDSGEQLFFLKLWVQLQESIRGPESPGLLNVARRVGCDAFARELLKSGNAAQQLLAILALGHFRDRLAWDLLVKVAGTPDTIRSYSALRALVQIDAVAAATVLTPLLLKRVDWPLARIAALLQSAQSAFAGPLLSVAEKAEGQQLIRTMRILEALRLQPSRSRLVVLLASRQPVDTVIGALRLTLAPTLLPRVRSLISHPDWRVRVHAAKALGRIGEFEDIPRLSKLLSDPEWWVRYRAANALIGLPFVNRAQIEMLSLSSADAYARNILEQVLFERAAR